MAYSTITPAGEKGLIKAAQGLFATLAAQTGAALARSMERQSRLGEVRRLEALSDAELAAQGIRREAIVQHVFRDKFCY